jgi:hypothetical protein
MSIDETDRPVQAPPASAKDAGLLGGSRPTRTQGEATAAAATQAPSLAPTPVDGHAAGATDGVTATWRNGVLISALWTIEETRNAFVHVAGVGWRKIYNGRDGAFAALVTLASQARQTNRAVNLREEADGMIHEIYLW